MTECKIDILIERLEEDARKALDIAYACTFNGQRLSAVKGAIEFLEAAEFLNSYRHHVERGTK